MYSTKRREKNKKKKKRKKKKAKDREIGMWSFPVPKTMKISKAIQVNKYQAQKKKKLLNLKRT